MGSYELCDTRVVVRHEGTNTVRACVVPTSAVPSASWASDRPISAYDWSTCEFDASAVQGKAVVMHQRCKTNLGFNAGSTEPQTCPQSICGAVSGLDASAVHVGMGYASRVSLGRCGKHA